MRRWFVWSSLALIFIIGSLMFRNGSVSAQSGSPTAVPSPTVTPYLTEVTVLLAPLPKLGTLDATPAIRAALNTQILKNYTKVTITAAPQAFKSSDEARAYAAKNGKFVMAVWGEASTSAVIIHFEMLRRLEYESYNPLLRQNTTAGGVYPFLNDVQLPLDAKLDAKAITAFTQAQLYFAAADYQRAQTAISDVATYLEANNAVSRVALSAEVDFELGFLAALRGQDNTAGKLIVGLAEADVRPALKTIANIELAAVLLNERAYDDALSYVEKALEIDPQSSWALLTRGSINFQQRNDQAALDDYDEALKSDAQNQFALNDRGWLQYLSGNNDEALKDLTEAIKIDSRYVDAYLNRSTVYRALRQGAPSLSDATMGVTLSPNYALGYALRGNLYYAFGEYDLALADYNRAVVLDPTDAVAYANRGGAYEQLGNDAQAFQDYTRAIAIDPSDAFAYLDRGRLYLKRGEYENAILDESLAIQFDTRKRAPVAYYYRAQGYQGLKRWDEAIKDYNKYISADPRGQYVAAAKATITAIRALLTPTPPPTDQPTDTPEPSDTPEPTSTRTPTKTLTPFPTPTRFASPTFIPTLDEAQIIGTSVARTATIIARNTKIASTIQSMGSGTAAATSAATNAASATAVPSSTATKTATSAPTKAATTVATVAATSVPTSAATKSK